MRAVLAVLAAISGIFVALIGLLLVIDGWTLMRLGGSWYYLLAGVGLIVSGGLLAARRAVGGVIFGAILLLTIVWAVFEAGFFFWALLPRVTAPVVIGLLVVLTLFTIRKDRRGLAMKLNLAGVGLGALLMASTLVGQYSRGTTAPNGLAPDVAAALAAVPEGDWRFWGRDGHGTRFAPFDQINADNVRNLEVAWQIQTGEVADNGSEDQNTPMQVGDTLYLCTPRNQVIAVNADSGEELWRHDPEIRGGGWNRCRGVGYYEASAPAEEPLDGAGPAPCLARIVSTTIDGRMFELDAETGERCEAFGEGGVVDLSVGMGEYQPRDYYPTSAPTVTRDLIIIGGWVSDGAVYGKPSGLLRAFSAETGELVWAWDMGNPDITTLPPEGESYTRATPNVWSTPAFDEEMGLLFAPIGNTSPDYWGSHRTDVANEYNASVVALDIETGREVWHFRTVNHDVWDWDVPSQPLLIDFPMDDGSLRPAVVQFTKRGQTFVLDRVTGEPLVEVEQRAVPQDPAPGEYLAATQPFSAMPALGSDYLHEKDMWGITPLDQLRCRIQYRSVRYEGEFTPPGVDRPSLQNPGNAGGMNWGSGSWDGLNNQLVVSVIRMPQTVQLTPTDDPDMAMENVADRSALGADGVPYRARNIRFMSEYQLPWERWTWMKFWGGDNEAAGEGRPVDMEESVSRRLGGGSSIGIPCIEPPHGFIAAVDLETREVLWQVPTDTAANTGPWGMRSGLNIPVGGPTAAGVITTAGGLTFHAGPSDNHLRAFDSRTGKVVWEHELPVAGGANPMTYVSPETGRQYVVISAGGSRRYPERGDYVVAFALPDAP